MEIDKPINIEKLTAKNWCNWKFKMELILKENNLYKIISGNECSQEGDSIAFMRRADKAFRLIALSVGDQYLGLLRKAGNARDAWKALVEHFERSCLTNQMILWKRFVYLKYDTKDDMQVHINNLIDLKIQLEAVGHHVNEIMMIMVLLESLPRDYDSLIIALETQKESIDFDFASSRVLEEFERQKARSNDDVGGELALNVTSKKKFKKFKGKCNHCHRTGHIAKYCFERLAQEKKRNEKSEANFVTEKVQALLANFESEDNDHWLIDSGASNHMCFDRNLFINFKETDVREVTIANGKKIHVVGTGDVEIKESTENKLLLTNVLFVPELRQNLISVSKVTAKGINVIFSGNEVHGMRNNEIIFRAIRSNGVFKLHVEKIESYIVKNDEVDLTWHKRLGHIGKSGFGKIIEKGLLPSKVSDDITCESCSIGKQVRKSFSSSFTVSNDILELVHFDVCGPMPVESIGGSRYYLSLLDDYSHYSFVYFLKKRDEVPEKLIKFINLVCNQKNKNLKVVRSDAAKENINKNFVQFLEKKGIKHEKSCPHTPEQNGKAERLNRSLQEIVRCLLIESKLDQKFWAEATHTANYLLNLRPSSSIDYKIPYELWTGNQVDYSHLKVFGCLCSVLVPKTQRKKLDPSGKRHLFMGYSDEHKGYKVYDLEKNKVFVSINVNFNENEFMTKSEFEQNNSVIIGSIGIKVPNCYSEAMTSNQHVQWKEACDEEMKSLQEKGTWLLVEKPVNVKLIKSKWVFDLKTKGDGQIERFKARLVAKGYSQRENIDYHETFSPVSKFSSIRLIFSLAVIEKMKIKQLDIKTAFLNGHIDEDLFMSQPEGYDDNSGKVCKLFKSLYGLKQASYSWNIEIDKFIRRLGFIQCQSDYCIYFSDTEKSKSFIILYVDDLLILSADENYINSLIGSFSSQYETKVMDKFDYFLGINIHHDIQNNILSLNQCKYVNEILVKFGMIDCKGVNTPMDPNTKLIRSEQSVENEQLTKYQQIVGSFHYLVTCTRPDLAIATSLLSQFNGNPDDNHFSSAKRVLRYLKKTPNLGISIRENGNVDDLVLIGYADADWAGNFDEGKSATGYLFYLNDNLISWSTKKQQTTALSSTEAEYMAETEAAKEAMWLKMFINELGYEIKLPITINCDNQGAIRLAKNPVYHSRTKHINVKHHFIRDHVKDGLVQLNYVNTSENIADILTKPLHGPKFNQFKKLIVNEIVVNDQ